jgi:phosphatidylserine/phosphatidylglycerophosphate/cardiolipin synthase-like enzyme
MKYARKLIQNAKEGALFLFFNPGKIADGEDGETLLQTVVERMKPATAYFSKDLYVRGVVNQKIAGLTGNDESADPHDPNAATSPVLLYGEHAAKPVQAPKSVLVPAAIKAKFAGWEKELLSMGVMVHSKVVILDPFGDYPVVMTGSHNLGTKASRANDDNLVIIEGAAARPLAIAYAVNIIAIYQEYRWRNYVATHSAQASVWHGLVDDDKWQDGHLVSDRAELMFWLNKGANGAAAANREKVAAPG